MDKITNESGFATFKPIELKSNPSKEDISNYYKENNIVLESNFLNDYFGLSTSPTPPTNSFAEGLKNQAYNISALLKRSEDATTSVATPSTTGMDLTSGNTNHTAKQIIQFFENKGLSKEQAAGIAGNLHLESGFKTTALGDGGTSYGLAQWHNTRWDNLKKFTKDKGLKQDSFEGQLEFLWEELNTTHKSALNELRTATTPERAAKIFSDKFERPKVYSMERAKKAGLFYNI